MRNEEGTRRGSHLLSEALIFPLVIVLLGISAVVILLLSIRHAGRAMDAASAAVVNSSLALIMDRAQPVLQANRSAFAIASAIQATTNFSFFDIENNVAPRLFVAFTTLTLVSQISFAGMDELVFSYYHRGDGQIGALFTNSSRTPDNPNAYTWYDQAVDPLTGDRQGDAVVVPPQHLNQTQWFHGAFDDKSSRASLGIGWGESKKGQMLFFAVPVGNSRVVSIGIAADDLLRSISTVDLHGGRQCFTLHDEGSLSSKQEQQQRFHHVLDISRSAPGPADQQEGAEIPCTNSDQGSVANDRNYPALRSSPLEEALNLKGVHSLLFIEGDETKRILQKWMSEDLGIKVWTVQHVELLCPALEKIKHTTFRSSKSGSYDNMESEGFLSPKNEMIQCLPITVRNNSRKLSVGGMSLTVLVVVDLSCGNLMEIYSSLSKLIDRSIHVRQKITCLASVYTSADDLKRFEQLPCDLILKKPLHGSRLYALLRLIQELQKTHEDQQLNYPAERMQLTVQPRVTSPKQAAEDGKPLGRMRILLVEDNQVLHHIVKTMLLRLGAMVESAENGSEAVSLIKVALQATNIEEEIPEHQRESKSFPFNVVLME